MSNHEDNDKVVLPITMHPMERFFVALFRRPPSDLIDSHKSRVNRLSFMESVCSRVQLPNPQNMKIAVSTDLAQHMQRLASLVLEESRFAVAQALDRRWKTTKTSPRSSFKLRLSSFKRLSSYSTALSLSRHKPFEESELRTLRSGSVCELVPTQVTEATVDDIIIGTVWTQTDDVRPFSISLTIYTSMTIEVGDFVNVYPVDSLLPQARLFGACTCHPFWRIGFADALANHHESVGKEEHPGEDRNTLVCRRDNDDRERSRSAHDHSAICQPEIDRLDEDRGCRVREQFAIPTLNAAQEAAQKCFLESPIGSVSLVQGPPGTGKTTLLTATICNYLLRSLELPGGLRGIKRRLMVCAPTNKAVTVLAARFLKASQGSKAFKVVLFGDAEKLLTDDQRGLLRTVIATPTWAGEIREKWGEIISNLRNSRQNDQLMRLTDELILQMKCQIPTRMTENHLLPSMMSVQREMQHLSSCRDRPDKLGSASNRAEKVIRILLKNIKVLSDRVTRELLDGADVIFCTLVSSGASWLQRSFAISDLIVDEASSATEPETYIPFHLKPGRMMLVGDPKQLPATVKSPYAVELGLNRSLQERLMFDCQRSYVMLDVQYRMRPAISAFPSTCFYKGKIRNGSNVSEESYSSSLALYGGNPFLLEHTVGEESRDRVGSYFNDEEARKVVHLISEIRRRARLNFVKKWSSIGSIRVITFYKAQVGLIEAYLLQAGLQQVTVSSVDASQGCEADVIVVSFVRSGNKVIEGRFHSHPRRVVGFLTDDRRINVALTRAKYQLICVGNAKGLASVVAATTIQAFVQHATVTNSIVDGASPNKCSRDHNVQRSVKVKASRHDEHPRKKRRRLKE